MNIRPLQPGDYGKARALLEQIQRIHAQNRPDIFKDAAQIMPEALFGTFQAAPDRLSAVAEREDGSLAGICLTALREHPPEDFVMTERRYASVDVMSVAPESRRQGIAEAMLRYTRERAGALGLDSIELEAAAFNLPALSLYQKMGFTTQSYTLEWKLKQEEK